MTTVIVWVGNACYGALALMALWGAFYTILAWRQIARARFRNEQEQNEFLDRFDEQIAAKEFDAARQMCEEDPRAVPQLAFLAIDHRNLGYNKVRAMLVDRFQRDVLSELDHQLSWVNTMIKSAPMAGLYGTVLGMMGAFGQLSLSEKVSPTELAGNIMLALITTALGLTIAIPLIIAVNSITLRIRKLEELVGYGMARVMEAFKAAQTASAEDVKQTRTAPKQPQAAAAGEN